MRETRMLEVTAHYYRQFPADPEREVPAEGYGGWMRERVRLSREHTAVVVMHAWDCGTPQEYPGWYRAVEYIPRANAIAREVFPRLLGGVREKGLRLYHVVGGRREYYRDLPGYERAQELAGPEPPPVEQVEADESLRALRRFRAEHAYPGAENQEDIRRGFARVDFLPEARPHGEEGVAESGRQLWALCRADGVNHLLYAGFAINWCLLLSPGGMAEMSRHGIMCSAFRQAVTAVENRETARAELCKELGLWRVALAFGFVLDVDDFLAAL